MRIGRSPDPMFSRTVPTVTAMKRAPVSCRGTPMSASLSPPEIVLLRSREADHLVDPGHVAATEGEGLRSGVEVAFVAQAPLDALREVPRQHQTVSVNVAERELLGAPDRLTPVGPNTKEQWPGPRLGVNGGFDGGQRIARGDVVVLRKPDPGRRCLLTAIRALRLTDAVPPGVILEPVEATRVHPITGLLEQGGMAAVCVGDHQHLEPGAFRLRAQRAERERQRLAANGRNHHAQPGRHVSTSTRTEAPSAAMPPISTRPYAPPPTARALSSGSHSIACLIEWASLGDRYWLSSFWARPNCEPTPTSTHTSKCQVVVPAKVSL